MYQDSEFSFYNCTETDPEKQQFYDAAQDPLTESVTMLHDYNAWLLCYFLENETPDEIFDDGSKVPLANVIPTIVELGTVGKKSLNYFVCDLMLFIQIREIIRSSHSYLQDNGYQ